MKPLATVGACCGGAGASGGGGGAGASGGGGGAGAAPASAREASESGSGGICIWEMNGPRGAAPKVTVAGAATACGTGKECQSKNLHSRL